MYAGDHDVPVSAGHSADIPGSLFSYGTPAAPPLLYSLLCHSSLRTPWHYPTREDIMCKKGFYFASSSSMSLNQGLLSSRTASVQEKQIYCLFSPWKTFCENQNV